MPVTYGDVNYRRKYEAFQIVDASGKNPLEEAIKCAILLDIPKEKFDAWIKVCEFVYAKPKFVEQTADDSVRNADAALQTLKIMEEISARANGSAGERRHPSRLDERQSQVQVTPPTA